MSSGALDIGTLTGRIELEDRTSAGVTNVLLKLDQLEVQFKNLGHGVAESAAGFFTAEVALEAMKKAGELAIETFKELTLGGAKSADIEENFQRLTMQANRLGTTLLGELKAGTHQTIDDLTLMKMVNGDLAAGLNLTDKQFRTLSDGAYALSKATGEDVATSLEKMNDAMLTGRTRAVEMLTGHIDLDAAEKKLADSLGTTVDHLSEEGKLQAKRTAILEAVGAATGRLGEQTEGLDVKVDQLKTKFSNYEDELAKAIATSPHVIGAFDAIEGAIVQAFGGDTEDLIKTMVGWIDTLADGVAHYGPVVVNAFRMTRDWVVDAWDAIRKAATEYGPIVVHALDEIRAFVMDLYHSIETTWNALPDWMKEVTKDSILTAAGLELVSVGAHSVSGGVSEMVGEWGNLTTALVGLPSLSKDIRGFYEVTKTLVAVSDFSSLAQGAASLKLIGVTALESIGPLGQVALVATAVMAAWEVGKMEAVSNFFEKIGLLAQGYSAAEADSIIQTMSAVRAVEEKNKVTAEHNKLAADMKATLDVVNDAFKQNVTTVRDHTTASGQNNLVLGQTTDELKKQIDAWREISSAGTTWKDILLTIDGEVVEAVKYYLNAGVAAEKLATAYGLTATQVGAIAEAVKQEKDALAVTMTSLQETEQLWEEYFALRAKQGASATAVQKQQIDQWRDNEVAKLKDSDLAWGEHYKAIEAVAKEKLAAMSVDWDELQNHSRAALDDIAKRAKATYEEAAKHSDQYSQAYIAHLKEVSDAADKAAKQWNDGFNGAVDASVEKVRLLSGEVVTLAEKTARLNGPSSTDVTKANLEQNANYWGVPASVAIELAKKGFSFDEIIKAWQSGHVADWVPHGPKIPGFKEGGYGDFGSGTLAMLHGKEIITPVDKLGSMGAITNHFYVNGTGKDVAAVVSKELMTQLKLRRHFGGA